MDPALTFAIINSEETDATYNAIGSLIADDLDEATCTATLIAPNWIVTATHCALEGGPADNPFIYKPEQIKFLIGRDSTKPLYAVKLKRWLLPTNPKVIVNGVEEELPLDIKFGELSSPITKIAPFSIAFSSEVSIDPKVFSEIVGYGITDNLPPAPQELFRQKAKYQVTSLAGNAFLNIFSTERNFVNYLKHAHPGEDAIDRLMFLAEITPEYIVHAWDSRGRENGEFRAKPAKGWSNSCHGDSGGPLLQIKNGKKRIVGIISGGFNGSSEDCLTVGSRISIFGPELQKIMLKNGLTKPVL